jgi:tubulysin polyketide synthase-like protein
LSAPALLAELRRRGLVLSVDGEKIKVRGPQAALTAETAATISARKSELLVLIKTELESTRAAPPPITPEVRRRAAAFRRQMDEWAASGRWALPALVLPEAPEPRPKRCVSCGIEIGSGWRCGLCLAAIHVALKMAEPGPSHGAGQ